MSELFYKVITLVVDVGTEPLRDIFYSKVLKAEFDKLKNEKVFTKVQYDKVTGTNPDPDSYDISLLTTLLTNLKVCEIPAPDEGWTTTPPDPSDVSVGADLLRLRELRNEIVGHQDAQLDEAELWKYFGEVETVLVRLAKLVGADKEEKIKNRVSEIKTLMFEPLDDREKKLLEVFLQWPNEDNEKYQNKLTEVQNSLEDLHLKVDNIQLTKDAVDATRLDDTCKHSLESQVSGLEQSLSSIARQDDVDQIKDNLKDMGDTVQTILATMKMLQEKLDSSNRNIETLSQQATTSGVKPTEMCYDGRVQRTGTQPNISKVANPNAMYEKEILDVSRNIGFEWEQLRIQLDYTKPQSDALKASPSSVQQMIYEMLKSWHDVVVHCGENPRMLLAAAFVNASSNNDMAYKLVPKDQLDKNAVAQPATRERIKQITFPKYGYDQRFSPYPTGYVSMPVYVSGGNVQFGAASSMTIHNTQSINSSRETKDVTDPLALPPESTLPADSH